MATETRRAFLLVLLGVLIFAFFVAASVTINWDHSNSIEHKLEHQIQQLEHHR